jgi:hypothetical protein
MAAPRLVKLNPAADVQADLAEALGIVEALDPPADLRAITFQLAAPLLTARAVDQSPSIPLGAMMQVPRTRGH